MTRPPTVLVGPFVPAGSWWIAQWENTRTSTAPTTRVKKDVDWLRLGLISTWSERSTSFYVDKHAACPSTAIAFLSIAPIELDTIAPSHSHSH